MVLIDASSDYGQLIILAIFHELIHVYDYKLFADKYNNGSYNKLYEVPMFNEYSMYSEFRAFAISELNICKYLDKYMGTTSLTISTFENFLQDIADEFLKEREVLLRDGFSLYKFTTSLSQLYTYDLYSNVTNVLDSCAYELLPLLYHSNVKDLSIRLYELYFNSIQNQSVFENLYEIKNLQDQILHIKEDYA